MGRDGDTLHIKFLCALGGHTENHKGISTNPIQNFMGTRATSSNIKWPQNMGNLLLAYQ